MPKNAPGGQKTTDIAHAMKTSLSVIRSCAQTLRRGDAAAEEETRLLKAIERHAAVLGRLIDELSRAERSAHPASN